MQQHPIQFDVAGHDHSIGSARSPFALAEGIVDLSRRSPVNR
jgi:hypothetical protein